MKIKVEFEGLDTVLRNLNKEIKGIRNRTAAGLVEASLYLKAQAVKRTPVDLGNLRGSAYTINTKGETPDGSPVFKGDQGSRMGADHAAAIDESKGEVSDSKLHPSVVVGYSAFYAPYVHEIDKQYTKGGWKYLETAINESKGKILSIIRKEAKIKK